MRMNSRFSPVIVATLTGMLAPIAHARLAHAEETTPAPAPVEQRSQTSQPAQESQTSNESRSEQRSYGRDPSRLALSFGGEVGPAWHTEGGPWGTGKGIGRALSSGVHLGLRASIEVLPWLAFDARGVVTNNEGNDLVNSGSFLAVGGFGAARLSLPFWRIRPYLLLGYGGYSLNASGKSTLLVSSSVSAYQVGAGALIPVSRHVDVGVEYLYTQYNGELLTKDDVAGGGDPNALSVFAQYRFQL